MARKIIWKGRKKAKAIDIILERISKGESVRKILSDDRDIKLLPSRKAFNEWLRDDVALSDQYARACEERADLIFEEILTISDTPLEGVTIDTFDDGTTRERKGDMLAHRKLQVDSRKWMLSKMQPKKYGDKIDVTTGGESLNYQPIWGKIDPVLDDTKNDGSQ